jgi:hypothetical protein
MRLGRYAFRKAHLNQYPFLYAIIDWTVVFCFQAPYLPHLDMFWNVQVTLQHESIYKMV